MKLFNLNFYLNLLRKLLRTEKNREDQFDADLIGSFSFFGLPFVIFLLITQATKHEGFVYIFITLISMAIINLLLLRYSKVPISFLGILSSYTLFFCMLAFCILQNTFFHGSFYWFIPSLIISLIFVKLRYSILILLSYLGVILYSHTMFRSRGFRVTDGWLEEDFMNNLMINQLAAILFSFVLLLLFFKNRERSIRELQEAHDRILSQQESMFHNSRLAELGEVAGGIAHEINNPLQVIAGNVQILQKEYKRETLDKEKAEKHLNKINETVLRISKIITTMRGYSRDGSRDEPEIFQVSLVIEEIHELVREKLKMNEISFEIIGQKDLKIKAKRVQIFQVLLNLINNSIDALEKCDTKIIIVELKSEKNWNNISVIDSGLGIPKEIEKKIFLPFFTTKPFGKGTGLGLSISYKILKDHHGQLIVDRSSGDSRMTLKLPNT
ncbi:MAG: hypothetical protein COW00_03840 [Bdellovibrio sp. CG12_big_fil_rev_8_21_14_0_65_39_13]|nr:MAG: hypothetical protein COW78_14595 [Bdellovibrio sp. CG22_combo_CG10-13_8_21_14_all_39_27]PIQ61492.1 MAG: hypothetical protein COW00_03840 [Bdellovibrio sp. CG12_big_fil_rev_8_21_14_0_65_39_13]PIR35338.1 MAG: hypothetical protein COV37_09605 [Bdellovibrio sp. CG11_big_fil_rev_8_21_14_0_20_39_38]